jgi:hypothetical protein
MFLRHPLQDTVYVLFDRPSRVFLHAEHKSRIFGNIWMLNGSLIFRGLCHVSLSRRFLSDVYPDSSGALEGENLVRDSSTRYHLRHCERPVVYYGSESRSRLNHSYLQPIVTAPSVNSLSDGAFEVWTALNHPVSHSVDIHIYGLRESPASSSSLVSLRASGLSNISCKPLRRTYLHRLQRPRDLCTGSCTRVRLSICLTMIYSWVYSTTTDWQMRTSGMYDLGGARSLTFVGDGVGLYSNRYSTWVFILYAHMVPL